MIAPSPTPAPTEADLANAAAEKAAADERLLDFQIKRAGAGSPTAQYELGLRYLTGKGVEKNLLEGRKWLEASAKQDNVWAQRKLKELDEQPEATARPFEVKTGGKVSDSATDALPPATASHTTPSSKSVPPPTQ